VGGLGLWDLDDGERALGAGELDDLDGLHRLAAAKYGGVGLLIGLSALQWRYSSALGPPGQSAATGPCGPATRA
jgi:hypothetical protein